MQSDFEETARRWSEESESVSSSVRVNIEDGDDEFVLTAERPGFEKDDVDVRVTDGTLRLKQNTGGDRGRSGGGIRSARATPCLGRPVDIPPRGRGGGRCPGHVQ
jgi:HSP20 family protein